MTWQDDNYPGSCDYPMTGEDGADHVGIDPWDDPAFERAEDVE